jgi:diacylglycerol kinase family enzyme
MLFSRSVPDGPLSVDIVVNTRAGRLSHRGQFRRVQRTVQLFTAGLEGEHRPKESVIVHYHFTQYHGHAREIARRILLAGVEASRHRVIVSLGGDGTHGELLSVLSKADPVVLTRTTVFRLPLGSGNDGADAPDLVTALRLLLSAPTARGIPYLRVRAASGRSFDAFNLVSVGIDAFVTDVSARLKSLVPGNLYRVAASASAALYQTLVRPREMTAELGRRGQAPIPRAGRFLLVAAGPTGSRTYGNGMRILPTEENVCLVHRMSTLQVMLLKGKMYRGEHVELPVVETFSAGSVTLRHEGRLPLQADGEATWLSKEDFPLTIYRAWSGFSVPAGELSRVGRRAAEPAAVGTHAGQENS